MMIMLESASRGASRGFHLLPEQRRMQLEELMRCQGMKPSRLSSWSLCLSATRKKKCYVHPRIAEQILVRRGLVVSLKPKDGWRDSSPKFVAQWLA
eukprot:5296659-Amphidinium_carterae.1